MKKDIEIKIPKIEGVFFVTGIILLMFPLIAIYLNDTKILPVEDTTWYKIMFASSLTSMGGYLFGRGNAKFKSQ